MNKVSVSFSSKTLWTILVLIFAIFVSWQLRNFLMIVLVSVIIASFVEAGTRALKKFKIPRVVSVFFFYILGLGVLFGILYLVVPLFTSEISNFIGLFPSNSSVVAVLGPLAHNGFTAYSFKSLLANKALLSSSNGFLSGLSGFFGGVLNGMLVIIISFYLAIQENGIEQFLRVVIPDQYEDYVVDLWSRTERKIGYWFGGQAVVAVIVALVTYTGLFFLGAPYAIILSALSFVFEFFPFGTILSLVPAVILGYLGGGLGLALQIFLFYGIIHYIDAYMLQPYILHRTIGMPMLVIILSIIACVELFGVIGVLVAVPIAVLLLEIIYDQDKHRRKRGEIE